MSRPSPLDAHLAEIDRRLRTIQDGLAPGSPAPGSPDPGSPAVSAAPVSVCRVGVSAGPFPDAAALTSFERALAGLPGVLEVRLREYEGADRALFELRLDVPIS
ncbi:MAG: hypothetical protein ACRDMX_13830 [Solirubrobacteraceae bacterium]